MKRHAPMTRSKPLRSRSKKTVARYSGPTGRRALVTRLLHEREYCEAGCVIGAHTLDVGRFGVRWNRCAIVPRDVHEILARSAGGDILDEANLLCVCRACHEWIGRHPRKALELGLRRSRYGTATGSARA